MPSMLLSVSMNAALFSIRASFASDDARSTSLKKIDLLTEQLELQITLRMQAARLHSKSQRHKQKQMVDRQLR